jgi:hypothetical protein
MTAADFFVKSMTAVWTEFLRQVVAIKGQPVPQSIRPKLDVAPLSIWVTVLLPVANFGPKARVQLQDGIRPEV